MRRIPTERSLGLDKRNKKGNCRVPGEGGTEWQMAATSLHNDVLLDSEECCESLRWWKAVRAPAVAKWQQKYRVEWDVTDGRNGGAQRTIWKYCWKWRDLMEEQKQRIKVAVALVLDLAKAFERVSLFVVWAWATHFCFQRKILRVLCEYFEHQRRMQFEGCAAEPLMTITAILPGSKWSCLRLRRTVFSRLPDCATSQ